MKRIIYQKDSVLKETDEYDAYMANYFKYFEYKKYQMVDPWSLKDTSRGEFLSETLIYAKSNCEFHKIYNAYLFGKDTI